MWREGAGGRGHLLELEFDLVFEPGELAESEDRGLTATAADARRAADPLPRPADALPREQADRELGLDPAAVNAIVRWVRARSSTSRFSAS